jgi:hypothetical protein
MATTPAPSTGFDWKLLLGVLESAGNTAVSVLIPGGAAFAPLIMALEQAVNPLINSIGQKSSTTSEVMTVFGTTIGILNILKAQPGLPAATLAKVEEYLSSAQAGLAAYVTASNGFEAAQFAPVTPIA